jgi:hypothetical protein
MKEATLLRLYLRLERRLPHAMMAIAGTVLKMIVCTRYENTLTLVLHGSLGPVDEIL